MECSLKTMSNLSKTLMDSSIRVRERSPIFRSSGANQQRTPAACKSLWSLRQNSSSREEYEMNTRCHCMGRPLVARAS